MQFWRNIKGFTLAEVILTVGVLAILVTMTTPGLIHFMRQRDVREEMTMQLKIRDAMVSMITATGDLPDDTATGATAWYNMLAKYTELSPYQMQFDEWRVPRTYILLRNNQTMLNSPVTIFYVTLHSSGPDQKAVQITDSGGNVLVPTSGSGFAASSASTWWKNNAGIADHVAAFGNVGVPNGVDDIMLRYTDYPDKIAKYNATLDRLNKLTDALEAYSRSAYANRVVACNVATPPADCATNPPEKQIHYPMGYGVVTSPADSTSNYNATVLADALAINGSNSFYNGTDNNNRRTAMLNLMRMLGLPDSNCCSAIDHFTDSSGNVQDTPFFYSSNPQARASATGCSGTRFPATTTPLPARLTTSYVANGTSGASCL